MKGILLSIIVMVLVVSCEERKRENEYETKYRRALANRGKEFNKMGQWEYSPNGKDSVWTQGTTNSILLLDSVIAGFELVSREWDSLLFLAKKYDTVPYPSEKMTDRWLIQQKRYISLTSYGSSLKEAVDVGIYDRNGKQLKKP